MKDCRTFQTVSIVFSSCCHSSFYRRLHLTLTLPAMGSLEGIQSILMSFIAQFESMKKDAQTKSRVPFERRKLPSSTSFMVSHSQPTHSPPTTTTNLLTTFRSPCPPKTYSATSRPSFKHTPVTSSASRLKHAHFAKAISTIQHRLNSPSL